MKEGFAFGAGLIVVGLALQFSVGPIHWSDFAFPLNGIFSSFFFAALVWSMCCAIKCASLDFSIEWKLLYPFCFMLLPSRWQWD